MAKEPAKTAEEPPQHRGRIQAQGGGTEKSVSWARSTPPTVTEMLGMCDQLETKLSKTELKDRQPELQKLRQFLQKAAQHGGINAPYKPSRKKAGSRDIRIDLEVISGRAAVPTIPEATSSEDKND
jgi:hypothetical protein